jgi:crotonobetainyl-CoA:carnitine CoA-transferase CaiB-like acyl-CoA transferase
VVAPGGAPRLGAHTREVLTTLSGVDDAMLDELESQGVI